MYMYAESWDSYSLVELYVTSADITLAWTLIGDSILQISKACLRVRQVWFYDLGCLGRQYPEALYDHQKSPMPSSLPQPQHASSCLCLILPLVLPPTSCLVV